MKTRRKMKKTLKKILSRESLKIFLATILVFNLIAYQFAIPFGVSRAIAAEEEVIEEVDEEEETKEEEENEKNDEEEENESGQLEDTMAGGHICLIIGYNPETAEIAISDSWGPVFAERWVPIEEMQLVSHTYGGMYVIRW